jgi:hypothetical protein
MLRGQTAPLSPNEEITLRRIALGVAPVDELRPRDVARLETLALVQRVDERLVLTSVGRSRYEALPRATDLPDAPDDAFRGHSKLLSPAAVPAVPDTVSEERGRRVHRPL